jgi:serine/threonine-protein kinase
MKSCPLCQNLYPANFTVCPKDGATLRTVTELTEGAVLRGKYQILGKLGQGGMGIVYKAKHLHFDEICALKVVTSHLAEEAGFLHRFRAEALVMRKLAHPNAVRVQDFDETEDGRPFMVMEYVEGRSLDKLLATGIPFPPRRAVRITMQAASALGAAHALGIIHRDIKPANILLAEAPDGGDLVKVLDFGVAKVKEGSTLVMGGSLTRTGFVVGTPEYMSPEQARGVRGEELDGRTDLYSLGVVLYEMLTGRLPFTADTPVMMLMAHVQTEPLNPRELRADLPLPLTTLVLRALEKDPERRFPTAEAMREALETLEQDRTVRLTPAPAPSAVRGLRTPTPPPRVPPPPPPPEGRISPPGAKQAVLAAPAMARPARPVFAPAEEPSRSPWMYVAIATLVVAGAAGGFLWYRSSRVAPVPAEGPAPTVETAAPPPAASQPQPTAPAAQAPATQPPAAEEAQSEEVRKLLEYGRDALRRGDREAAAGFFRGALALDPENRLAREGLRRAQRPPEPIRPAAPKIDEAAVQRLMQEGKQAMDAGRYEEAIRNFQAVLDLDPNHPGAQRGLALARRALAAEQEVLRPR